MKMNAQCGAVGGTAGDASAGCAWIDNEFVAISDARIPILDVGFVRSDLTYDVVGVWKGSFFRLDDHLDRLLRGCERLRIDVPMSRDEMREVMFEVVRRSGLRESYVEIIVTRGVPGRGERDPRKWTARVYAFAIPYVWIVAPDRQEQGTDVVLARDTRRIPTGAVDPTVKSFHWGDLTRGLFEAYDRGAWLAIMSDGDGLVTEGAGFNVFAVSEGKLVTPARGVLEGITRRTTLEIAAELGLEAEIGDLPVSHLFEADEIFLTSTAGGVMPVKTLDGRNVGEGEPGPVALAIHRRYWQLHEDPEYCEAIDYGVGA